MRLLAPLLYAEGIHLEVKVVTAMHPPTPVEATSLGPGYPDMANTDYLQVMSPNLDGSSSATTISRTITAHRQEFDNARVIPVPNGSL